MLNTGSLTIQRQMANSWLLHCSQVSERPGFLRTIIQQIPWQGDGSQPRLVSFPSKPDGLLHSSRIDTDDCAKCRKKIKLTHKCKE